MFTKKLRPMNNLKLDLIEKVRNNKAQVYNDLNKPNLIIELFSEIANRHTVVDGNGLYYSYDNISDLVYKHDRVHATKDTIALSAFFTNQLTPEDNKTIELIAEKVDRLYKAMFPDDEPNVEPSPAKDEVKDFYCFGVQNGNHKCLNQCEHCARQKNHQAQQQVEDVKESSQSIYDISVYQNPIDTDNYGIQISAEFGIKFTREFAKDLATKIKNLLKN